MFKEQMPVPALTTASSMGGNHIFLSQNPMMADMESGNANNVDGALDHTITILVEGKEMKENTFVLREWTPYFEAAIKHGTLESQSKTVELKDFTLDEWNLVRNLARPFSCHKINATNVMLASRALSKMSCSEGMDRCAEFLVNSLDEKTTMEELLTVFGEPCMNNEPSFKNVVTRATVLLALAKKKRKKERKRRLKERERVMKKQERRKKKREERKKKESLNIASPLFEAIVPTDTEP